MLEQSYKGFGKPPDPIANAPELFHWLVKYYRAFEELASDRPTDSMGGTGYIPWTSIDRYGRRHSVLFSDFDRLVLYVRILDLKYVNLARAAQAERDKRRDSERKAREGNKAARHPRPPGVRRR